MFCSMLKRTKKLTKPPSGGLFEVRAR